MTEFETYPGAQAPENEPQGSRYDAREDGDRTFLICVMTHFADRSEVDYFHPEGRYYSEPEAVNVLDRICEGTEIGPIDPATFETIVRVNPHEMLLSGWSLWSGNRFVRLVVASCVR